MNAVMYGAGNIGRGFIGQLFSQSGYDVIFVDVNDEVVERLNIDNEYPIHIISETGNEDIMVKNVRAVNARDGNSVSAEICRADIMGDCCGCQCSSQDSRTNRARSPSTLGSRNHK